MSDSQNFLQYKKRQNSRKELIPFASTKHADNTDFDPLSLTLCLEFPSRSRSIACGALLLSAQSVRYPDSLRSVRPEIRSRKGRGDSRKKAAFTLVEVLITLGIIGVVAAMTIPNLISAHSKKVTVTKLQKAISVLNQAYRLAYDEVGEPSEQEAYSMGGQAYFEKYWNPYLRAAHFCTTYSECGYKSNTPYKSVNGDPETTVIIWQVARVPFYTADGFFYNITTRSGSGNEYVSFIILDLNGGSAPNRLGKDVFFLTVADMGEVKGGVVVPMGYNASQESIDSSCKSKGYYCAAKIKNDGWTIADDYPW